MIEDCRRLLELERILNLSSHVNEISNVNRKVLVKQLSSHLLEPNRDLCGDEQWRSYKFTREDK